MKFNLRFYSLLVLLYVKSDVHCDHTGDPFVILDKTRKPNQDQVKCSDNEKVNEYFLALHNSFRKNHGSPPLELDPELMQGSMEWSRYSIKKKMGLPIDTTNTINNGSMKDFGQIMDSSTTSHKPNMDTLRVNVENWYNEGIQYEEGKDQQNGTDSFVQVVWKETKKLGCGICHLLDSPTSVITCRYFPKGNIKGKHSENVPTLLPELQKVSTPSLSLEPPRGQPHSPSQHNAPESSSSFDTFITFSTVAVLIVAIMPSVILIMLFVQYRQLVTRDD